MKTQAYLLIIGSFVLLLAGCSNKKASTAYVETLGNDTLTVESFTRSSRGYRGKLLQRMPATQVASYDASLNNDGSVSKMKIQWNTPKGNPKGPKSRFYSVAFKDTVATVDMSGVWRGGNVDTTFKMSVPKGAVPSLGKYPPAVSTFQQVIDQAQAQHAKMPYSTKIIFPGSHRLISAELSHISQDTLALKGLYGYLYIAKVNNQNKIVWYSGKNSTVKTIAKPEPNVNLNDLAMMFAKRDAEGKGMPIASPLDSAKATVDGAHLKIVYSRPSVRGRKIWGGLVPWNTVWRTGANAATSFSTDKDLTVGGTKLPAGNYTLYSIYTPNSAKLIINSQTGQWGTVYHKDQDFARIPMKRSEIVPKQKFLISIDSTQNGGMLQLSWDQYRYEVPFQVK